MAFPVRSCHNLAHYGQHRTRRDDARVHRGHSDGSIDLSLVEFQGAKPVSRVRKQFSGAREVFPFWSRGSALGCLVVGEDGSQILSMFVTKGEEEVLYESRFAEERIAPAWSMTEKYIAFFQSARPDAGGLVLLDCDMREILPLLKTAAPGVLSFGEETISIAGGDAAVIVWPQISHKRIELEKF